MPSAKTLRWLSKLPASDSTVSRLSRRYVAPLASAPKRQGRIREIYRLGSRAVGLGHEGLSYQANDWLMRTMADELDRSPAHAVHSYEDCSLWQFEKAKQKNVSCIYDMPIGYYGSWQKTESRLVEKYADWVSDDQKSLTHFVRPQQKSAELALADLVLVPSSFAERTVKEHFPNKRTARAGYGVDTEFWSPGEIKGASRPLTFIYAGQSSIRKGTPDLVEAWKKADLSDARLQLVGSWHLSPRQLKALPPSVQWHPPCSADQLRRFYREADIFVFPSYFEGFGLVLLEAMACGLPVFASDASAMPDLFSGCEGGVIPAGNLEALVETLRWAVMHRETLRQMGSDARKRAQLCTWAAYRNQVRDAVAPFLS